MRADGSGITQITDTATNELSKSRSPDGRRVVADLSPITPSGSRLGKGDIAVIDVATGATLNLTNTIGINEEHPDWSPINPPKPPARARTPPPVAAADSVGLVARDGVAARRSRPPDPSDRRMLASR
jgi:hypothetical protein